MLIYSMSVSVDGFIADRDGAFGWSVPSDQLFRFHTAQVRELGGYLLGRRLYETMLVWETDPSMRDDGLGAGREAPHGQYAAGAPRCPEGSEHGARARRALLTGGAGRSSGSGRRPCVSRWTSRR